MTATAATALATREPTPSAIPLPSPLVELANLTVDFGRGTRRHRAVNDVSLSVLPGECLALVGESGSGKSVTARTLVGLTGHGSQVSTRFQRFNGQNVTGWGERQWSRVRGKDAGFILQDALSSLDSLRTVGKEVGEVLRLHSLFSRVERDRRIIELLRSVGIPDPEVRASQYPHQLSGGLRQRALIASAIAAEPGLLIADEPTTALDATIAAQVLRLLGDLKGGSTGMLVVSHDLAVVANLADRVAVMRQGEIVEEGTMEAVLLDPQHPYTKGLLAAIPSAASRGSRLTGPLTRVDSPTPTRTPARVRTPQPAKTSVPGSTPERGSTALLTADRIHKSYPDSGGTSRTAVAGVSFQLRKGSTLGIVGESGSGKSTVARMVLGVEAPDAGSVRFRGRTWREHHEQKNRRARRAVQMIYQDPLHSFDPRKTVRQVIGQAVAAAGVPRTARDHRIRELLALVGLGEDKLRSRPLDLSGGQRQRVAIARALAAEPEIIICDEPVSALDVSVQATILDLFSELQERLGLGYLFISHDLGVIQHLSQDVLVMKDGEVLERGTVTAVFDTPQHQYTRDLINAIPQLPITPLSTTPLPATGQDGTRS
ncbi:ABC transporter ATP-binding protein [Arthrobacter sp. CAN_C5]|uniref:dipeptide ABC transporter ATP-binding protein n=1 Tax=Arthrobacter sp. CAN_C5 TaxID=2760706 RepID=UPI001AEA943E|nr:ABC transporter ATP-binding protein [Arthrobacter sp. CAN_C5]MBP2216722.1 peptide/nickel transport system ATP-binding protein [Arthrobacter sp. CAN_C5]